MYSKGTHVNEFVWESIEGEAAPSCETREHTRHAHSYLSLFALLAEEDVLGETVEE